MTRWVGVPAHKRQKNHSQIHSGPYGKALFWPAFYVCISGLPVVGRGGILLDASGERSCLHGFLLWLSALGFQIKGLDDELRKFQVQVRRPRCSGGCGARRLRSSLRGLAPAAQSSHTSGP